MSDPVETEIKLAATPAMLDALRSDPNLAGPERTAAIATTYFDTPDLRLRRLGGYLRVRQHRDGHEQTLKLPSPAGSPICRSEWTVQLDNALPDPAALPDEARQLLDRLVEGMLLEPFAKTSITREARRLRFGVSVIDVAFDAGTISAGAREAKVCEVELELVEGRAEDVIGLALALPLGPELGWSVVSKAERCHALALGAPPTAIMARQASLMPDICAARGFQVIGWTCLDHLLANYPLVVATGEPEAVHQCRVAIRRMRAAFSLFGEIVNDDDAPILRAGLRAVATSLGHVRDLDVLLQRLGTMDRTDDADVAEMLAHLRTRRDAAIRPVRMLLTGAPFQRLLLQLAAWLEGGSWVERKRAQAADQPLAQFAQHVLTQRWRKLRRSGRRLASMPDNARHRLRIKVKKLRYAAEFLAPLFVSGAVRKPRRKFGKALERLQDSLGELNDLSVATQRRETLFAELDRITAARFAERIDVLLAIHHASRRRLLKAAMRSLEKLNERAGWWRNGRSRR